MRKHTALEFEEKAEAWERTERAARHDFVFRNLKTYPRYDTNQRFPSCEIPCYHYNTGAGTKVCHATISKEGGNQHFVLNSLFDLEVTQIHNQAVIHDCLTQFIQYSIYKRRKKLKKSRLPTIPEERPLATSEVSKVDPEQISQISSQLTAVKADLREIKSQQSQLKTGFNQLRDSIQELLSRESEPKPIEAATAEVADQLKKQLKEVKAVLEDTKKIVRSLTPE
uniref:Uncharacterized protein n=1 Tax=Gooseberry vein banding associated virus TaxID=157270 RepID=F5BDD0_9VIRU|nr:unknown [Gooseberry vein banding associated virus]AEE39271.1 unknown [Gooseberry vein banding associated virus]